MKRRITPRRAWKTHKEVGKAKPSRSEILTPHEKDCSCCKPVLVVGKRLCFVEEGNAISGAEKLKVPKKKLTKKQRSKEMNNQKKRKEFNCFIKNMSTMERRSEVSEENAK